MNNEELSADTKKLQSIADSTDVLNTAEEIKEYNKLVEHAEPTTQQTRLPSVDGN